MTGLLLKGLGLFLLAAAVSGVIAYVMPTKLLPVLGIVVWLLPLGFLGLEFWSSAAVHDFDWNAIWRGTVSAGAQTLVFWPGALAGYYGVRALRGSAGGRRGMT